MWIRAKLLFHTVKQKFSTNESPPVSEEKGGVVSTGIPRYHRTKLIFANPKVSGGTLAERRRPGTISSIRWRGMPAADFPWRRMAHGRDLRQPSHSPAEQINYIQYSTFVKINQVLYYFVLYLPKKFFL